jgi:hypothetical protein
MDARPAYRGIKSDYYVTIIHFPFTRRLW